MPRASYGTVFPPQCEQNVPLDLETYLHWVQTILGLRAPEDPLERPPKLDVPDSEYSEHDALTSSS